MIKEIFQETEKSMKKAIESVRREFAEVRTGRAHPGIIEGLHVDYYETPTLLKNIATIAVPDPRTIVIQPWDPNAIADIEKGIAKSNLGLTPSNDGKIIRLNVPTLSEERRQELIKIVKDMAEHARVSIRTIRRDSNDHLKKLKGDKSISDDDHFKSHEDIQKLTDKYIKEVDDLLEEKSKALSDTE